MADWTITAKTIFCEAVDDEVTLLLQRKGEIHCTGCKKYGQPNSVTAVIIKQKSARLKRPIKCEGEQCPRVSAYQKQIMAEETR